MWFHYKVAQLISCVLLIGDNSHLMFKPQPDSKKNSQSLTTTSYKTDYIPQEPVVWGWLLWLGCHKLAVLGSLRKRQSLAILQMETLWPREGIGLIQSHPATESQGSIHPEWLQSSRF